MRIAILAATVAGVAFGVSCPHVHAQNCGPAHVLTGESAGYRFGRSVSDAGDIDRDGYRDFIVGANWIHSGSSDTGRVYVYSGKTMALLYYLVGEASFDKFGVAVSGAGDIDNDGHADIVVGAPLDDAAGTDAGRAYVYSGATGLKLHTFAGETSNDYFGAAVSGAGDVDGDGHADVIVGAHWNDAGGSNAGRAYVYSGATGLLLYSFTGEAAEDVFGIRVAAAGDADADGRGDLIVAAQYHASYSGRVYVFSGRDGTTLHIFDGEAITDNFGSAIAGIGDINRDGHDDVAVGARFNDVGGNDAGRAYVYSGATGALLYALNGELAKDGFGCALSGIPDVDRDGSPDLIVGADQDNNWGSTGSGRVYLYSGESGQLLTSFSGESANDWFGVAISGSGDHDRNGNPEIIVGAMFNDAAGEDAGMVYIYDCDFSQPCQCPHCPFEATDVNGTGATDVIDVTKVIDRAFRAQPSTANPCDPEPTP